MSSNARTLLDNGIAVIHANQLETLRDVVEYWLRQHPLAPLENEVFLVQSNGMGQWLKQSLAQNDAFGIAAAMQVQLPSLFIWSVYRAVLGQQIPQEQPLAKAPLTWRLYRLLPTLTLQDGFASLAHFLQQDLDDRKRHQLAEQLADLFDQYQVYRSDWISDWVSVRSFTQCARRNFSAARATRLASQIMARGIGRPGRRPQSLCQPRLGPRPIHGAYRQPEQRQRPSSPRRPIRPVVLAATVAGSIGQAVNFVGSCCSYITLSALLGRHHRRQGTAQGPRRRQS